MIKRMLFAISLLSIVLLSILFGGCAQNTDVYNLIITNNSDESFKSIGFDNKMSSGDVINADNSLIKPSQNITLNMETNEFNLHVITDQNHEVISQTFHVDFAANNKIIYNISIEEDSSGDIQFILTN
ncbi:MAG: hypothetical protein Q3980_10660 [Turicibacter sp.]|nr:hypothetical protein [Turicibacter sp.]